MPVSMNEGKWETQDWLFALKPKIVLDVGPGEGTYAKRMRIATPMGCRWECVEIFEPYVEQFELRKWYDEVYVDDIRNWTPDEYGEEDVVLFGDVLEHMEKTEALYVLGAAQEHARAVMVSIPIIYSPQGACFGNEHEAHLHQWEYEEMLDAIGPCKSMKGDVLGVYWWER